MKSIAFLPAIFVLIFSLNSCCSSCFKGKKYEATCCDQETYEEQITTWVEEEVMGDKGPVIVRSPIVRTVTKPISCTTCGSFYCASPGCCDTVSREVLKRATAQCGTGEPHIGQIPTMKVLAP
jgi:hypothetical protein